MNENKGRMPTKIELTLEQSQQGVSNDVLNIRVILFSIHIDDGNHSSVNIKQHYGRYKHRCRSLVPAKLDSLPHAHAQAFKVKHSASWLLLLNKNVISQKAQVHFIILFYNSDNLSSTSSNIFKVKQDRGDY
ncbi:hypothetical protein Tco_0875828 [Tanacetum coccineum]|uniref:Uncharacterized protein n=1 Tax=Tanacetum coccineum TaxID=301880 RepID=A0ABQ5BTB5_9ASTR